MQKKTLPPNVKYRPLDDKEKPREKWPDTIRPSLKPKALAAGEKEGAVANSEIVKTTIRMPRSLWSETSIRAIHENRDLQDIVADALRAYLQTPIKEGAR